MNETENVVTEETVKAAAETVTEAAETAEKTAEAAETAAAEGAVAEEAAAAEAVETAADRADDAAKAAEEAARAAEEAAAAEAAKAAEEAAAAEAAKAAEEAAAAEAAKAAEEAAAREAAENAAKQAEEALLEVEALPEGSTAEAEKQPVVIDGIPAAEPLPEDKKKKFPVKLIVKLLSFAAVIGLLALLIVSTVANKPLNLITKGLENSAKAAASSELGTTLSAVANSGSVGASVDLSKFTSLIGINVKGGVDVTAYSSWKAKKSALVLDAKLDGKSILDATFNLSADEIAASCAALLGKNNYGINFKNLAKTLPKSVVDPSMLTPYALPEEIYTFLFSQKEGLYPPMEKLYGEAAAVAQEARKVAEKSLNRNAELDKNNEKLDVGEDTVRTVAVSVTLDGKAIGNIAEDLLKWAKSSKSLRALLNSFIDTYGPLMEYANIDTTDFIISFYEAITDTLGDMEGLRDELEDVKFSGTFYVTRSGRQLVRADVSLKQGKQRWSASLSGGPDWKNAKIVSGYFKDPSGSKTSFSYTIYENSSEQYNGQLRVKNDKDTLLSASLNWAKKTGELKLSAADLFTLTGSMTKKNKVTTIELKRFEYGILTLKNLGTTVTVSESVKFPAIAKYTDPLTMKEEDIGKLIESVTEAVGELAERIKDAM